MQCRVVVMFPKGNSERAADYVSIYLRPVPDVECKDIFNVTFTMMNSDPVSNVSKGISPTWPDPYSGIWFMQIGCYTDNLMGERFSSLHATSLSSVHSHICSSWWCEWWFHRDGWVFKILSHPYCVALSMRSLTFQSKHLWFAETETCFYRQEDWGFNNFIPRKQLPKGFLTKGCLKLIVTVRRWAQKIVK